MKKLVVQTYHLHVKKGGLGSGDLRFAFITDLHNQAAGADGEKLYEEVLSEAESNRPTPHPKIMVARVREYPYDLALQNEKELYDLSFTYDDMAIVKKMKEIVPEYKSRHSKYETLD